MTIGVDHDHSGILYAGTTFSLYCDISPGPSVDTAVTIRALWSGPNGDISMSGDRYVISNAMNTVPGSVSNQMHRGMLMFIPLSTSDSGMYTCRVVVEATQFTTESDPGLGSVAITVQGKLNVVLLHAMPPLQ